MVTRFECPHLGAMLVLLFLHGRIKRQVAQRATGYLGATTVRSWRTRTVLSVSLWRDLESVYSMGDVPRHVHAARLPHLLGVTTRAGVFCYSGDWRQVMFGADRAKSSPLENDPAPTGQE